MASHDILVVAWHWQASKQPPKEQGGEKLKEAARLFSDPARLNGTLQGTQLTHIFCMKPQQLSLYTFSLTIVTFIRGPHVAFFENSCRKLCQIVKNRSPSWGHSNTSSGSYIQVRWQKKERLSKNNLTCISYSNIDCDMCGGENPSSSRCPNRCESVWKWMFTL